MFWTAFVILLLVALALGCLILGIGSILRAFDYDCVGSFMLGVGLIIGSCASIAGLITIAAGAESDKQVLVESIDYVMADG